MNYQYNIKTCRRCLQLYQRSYTEIFVCSYINVVTLRLHKTLSSIAFIKKVAFNELTLKFAIVKG